MQIDLSGPQGNAYALLALATSAARQLRYSEKRTSEIIRRMRSGSYEAILDTFDDEFPGIYWFVGDPRPHRKHIAPVLTAGR